MKYIIGIIIAVVLIVATITKATQREPTLEELSMCLTYKSDILRTKFLRCTDEDYDCMVDVVLEVCK